MRVATPVFFEPGAPHQMVDLEVDEPGAGEVRVRMVASGICHSCLYAMDGVQPFHTIALTGLVRATGLRDAYVSMICTRGTPAPGLPRHPKNCVNRFYAFCIPFVWVMPEDMQARGAHAIMAKTPRIPPECLDPTIKAAQYLPAILARQLLSRRGLKEGIQRALDGSLVSGLVSSLFLVEAGILKTPPLEAVGFPTSSVVW